MSQDNAQLFYSLDKLPAFNENLYGHAYAKVLEISDEDILVTLLYQPYRDSTEDQQFYISKTQGVWKFDIAVGDVLLLGQHRIDPKEQMEQSDTLPYSPLFRIDSACILDKISPFPKTLDLSVETTFTIKDKDGNAILSIDVQNQKITFNSNFKIESGDIESSEVSVGNVKLSSHIHTAGELAAPDGPVTGTTGGPQ